MKDGGNWNFQRALDDLNTSYIKAEFGLPVSNKIKKSGGET
jgi:hypothetical protein